MAQKQEVIFEAIASDSFGNIAMTDYVIVPQGASVIAAAPKKFLAATRFGLNVSYKMVTQEDPN